MAINVILARSPYQVIIDQDSQIKTKVELRLWNKGGTRPTNPTYIMSEGIASVTQRQTNYNISPFILEFIDKYKLQYDVDAVVEADDNEWCIGEYKTFYEREDLDFTLISTVSFCAVNGYSTVEQGLNFSPTQEDDYLLLANPNIKVYWNTIIPYYNFIVRDIDTDYRATWYDKSGEELYGVTFYEGEDEFFNYAIPLVYGASVYVIISNSKDENIYKIYTEEICEPKYPVQTMWFVNKFGGWNQFPFFKASYNSIDVKNSDYTLMQKNVNYDYRRGQTKPFNINGNESIKVNSGWVTEDYFEWIQDMMLSDTILYSDDEIPVTIKTTSMQKRTSINDKNINYTLEFDFANKLINNIV
jgi:hypothetical protein